MSDTPTHLHCFETYLLSPSHETASLCWHLVSSTHHMTITMSTSLYSRHVLSSDILLCRAHRIKAFRFTNRSCPSSLAPSSEPQSSKPLSDTTDGSWSWLACAVTSWTTQVGHPSGSMLTSLLHSVFQLIVKPWPAFHLCWVEVASGAGKVFYSPGQFVDSD
jgi:hypothetical protein